MCKTLSEARIDVVLLMDASSAGQSLIGFGVVVFIVILCSGGD